MKSRSKLRRLITTVMVMIGCGSPQSAVDVDASALDVPGGKDVVFTDVIADVYNFDIAMMNTQTGRDASEAQDAPAINDGSTQDESSTESDVATPTDATSGDDAPRSEGSDVPSGDAAGFTCPTGVQEIVLPGTGAAG
jgi:hypothetical protein